MKTLKDIYINRLRNLRLKVLQQNIASFLQRNLQQWGITKHFFSSDVSTGSCSGTARDLNKEGELIGVGMLLLDQKVCLLWFLNCRWTLQLLIDLKASYFVWLFLGNAYPSVGLPLSDIFWEKVQLTRFDER